MTISPTDVLQSVNLLLVPAFAYMVKIERRLARLEAMRPEIHAAHFRLDKIGAPPAWHWSVSDER